MKLPDVLALLTNYLDGMQLTLASKYILLLIKRDMHFCISQMCINPVIWSYIILELIKATKTRNI